MSTNGTAQAASMPQRVSGVHDVFTVVEQEKEAAIAKKYLHHSERFDARISWDRQCLGDNPRHSLWICHWDQSHLPDHLGKSSTT